MNWYKYRCRRCSQTVSSISAYTPTCAHVGTKHEAFKPDLMVLVAEPKASA